MCMNLPTGQASHVLAASVALKNPSSQSSHCVAPVMLDASPTWQGVQATLPFSLAKDPGSQEVHSVAPGALAALPGRHNEQFVAPGVAAELPGSHKVQVELPLPSAKEPGSHGEHSSEASVSANEPGAHSVQAVAADVFDAEPRGHGRQVACPASAAGRVIPGQAQGAGIRGSRIGSPARLTKRTNRAGCLVGVSPRAALLAGRSGGHVGEVANRALVAGGRTVRRADSTGLASEAPWRPLARSVPSGRAHAALFGSVARRLAAGRAVHARRGASDIREFAGRTGVALGKAGLVRKGTGGTRVARARRRLIRVAAKRAHVALGGVCRGGERAWTAGGALDRPLVCAVPAEAALDAAGVPSAVDKLTRRVAGVEVRMEDIRRRCGRIPGTAFRGVLEDIDRVAIDSEVAAALEEAVLRRLVRAIGLPARPWRTHRALSGPEAVRHGPRRARATDLGSKSVGILARQAKVASHSADRVSTRLTLDALGRARFRGNEVVGARQAFRLTIQAVVETLGAQFTGRAACQRLGDRSRCTGRAASCRGAV
eukprot:scaffold770_cov255-Pinguiococcus_pyrenoidosus.AAC.75